MTTTPVALPDEDRLDLPAAWRTAAPKSAYEEPDPEAPQRLRELLDEHRGGLEESIALPENALYAEVVRSYLDGKADPRGAAAAAALLGAYMEWKLPSNTVPDAWIVEHGLPFAVAATVSGGFHTDFNRVISGGKWVRTGPALLYRADRYVGNSAFERTAALRAAADTCDGTRYEEVRAAADEHRTGELDRYWAAFLFPREHEWVLEACAEYGGGYGATDGGMWPVISTAEQLAALHGSALMPSHLSTAALGTIMGNLGGDSLPALTATLEQGRPLNREERRTVLTGIAMLPTDAAMTYLMDHLDLPQEFEALCEAARRFPVRALRLAAARSATAEVDGRRRLAAVLEHIDTEVLEAATAQLETPERDRVRLLRERSEDVPSAGTETLPRLLVRPPWEDERRSGEPRIVKGLEAERGTVFEWLPGERQEWAEGGEDQRYRDVTEEQWAFQADGPLAAYTVETVAFGPDKWASQALTHLEHHIRAASVQVARRIMLRFEQDAAVPIIAQARRSAELREILLPLVNRDVARLMAEWHSRVKSARALALAWFDRHPAGAARLLIPDALGKRGKRRDCAEAALALLVRRHGPEAIDDAARSYGPEVFEAMRPIAETDPLEPIGGAVPAHPPWAHSLLLPQVLLEGRERALPETAVRHLTAALSVCTPEYEYEGVGIIAQCCDRRSLAEFSWALFRQWVASETPADGSWALTQLAYFADEDAVTGLVPYLQAWPGENRHHLAVAGLQALRTIGTEHALQAIHQVASRAKFEGLRYRAEELVDEIAAELGLTGEQLGDRLVPDFGLGEASALVLDYGPRQFTVGFDEQLKPFVTDMDGKVRKSLPKPGKRDDAEVAEASWKRFSQLKKGLRAAAGDQVRRLERAMIDGRTWSPEEFRRHFVEHPLMRHLTRRLVWTAETGEGTVSFRVDESAAFADAADDPLTLRGDAVIRLAHPVRIGADEAEVWAEVFSDYELLQPFEQLARPVMALTDDERRTGRLTRFEKVTVATGYLLGLTKRGWERSLGMDSGAEAGLYYAMPRGGCLNLELNPGITVGAPELDPAHDLAAVYFSPSSIDWFGDHKRAAPPEGLDPVIASELIWTLTKLTEAA